MQKRCKSCSAELPRRRGQQFCASCAKQRNLDQLAAKRRAAGIVPLGGVTSCDICSTTVTKSKGYKQFCGECRAIRRCEVVAASRSKPERKVYQRRKDGERRQGEARKTYMREYLNGYSAKRREHPMHRLNARFQSLIRRSLGSAKGGRRWRDILGYDLAHAARHIERQFVSGMSWENMRDWHIDHIVPLSSFRFETEGDPEFRAAWALTNLRPLWATANLRKGATRTHLL